MQPVYVNQANGHPPQIVALPRIQNVSCVLPATKQLGGLYIGNYFGACNVEILKQYGIRAVLTTSVQTPIAYPPQEIPFHKKVDAHDKENFSILDHFEECLEFIDKHRKVTNVFVHCYAGVSRSASVVLAYVMRFMGWSFDTALTFLRFKRSVVNPNEGFTGQLRAFEQRISVNPRVLLRGSRQEGNGQYPGGAYAQIAKSMDAGGVYGQPLKVEMNGNNPHLNVNPNINNSLPPKSPRATSVQNGKNLAFGNGRPPSQTPTRIPSAKTLPLYQQANRQDIPPPVPVLPAPRSHRTMHQQTPIPNFMMGKKQSQKDSNNTQKLSRIQKTVENKDQKTLRNSKVAIRPRDLPGYRVS